MKHLLISISIACILYQPEEKPKEIPDKIDPYKESVDYILQKIEDQRVYDSIYNKTLSFIRDNEGYREYPYKCLAGVKTVGYGHVIRENDSLCYPITKSQADSILGKDFSQKISFIENNLGLDRLKQPRKTLALAHFIFNIGEGNLIESNLYDSLIKTGQLDSSITKFIHIKTSDGYIKSSHLLKMREFEYNLFNGKVGA